MSARGRDLICTPETLGGAAGRASWLECFWRGRRVVDVDTRGGAEGDDPAIAAAAGRGI